MLEVRKDGDLIEVQDTELEGVEHGDPETSYTIRTISTETARALLKPFQRNKWNNRTHKLEEIPLTEEQQAEYTFLLLDHVLIDWKGIIYKGQPLPCEGKHKTLLDNARKAALLGMAGGNKAGASMEDARNESFRESEDVLPVLGR